MYKTKTTFIVGAGASLELGFPTSESLKNNISEAVNLRFEQVTNRVVRGDSTIAAALKRYSDFQTEKGAEEYNKYVHAGWHISKAMPQAISIDNFIEVQEDDYITKIAKLGIASNIIDAEKECAGKLIESKHPHEVIWSRFQKNWIHFFCQTLTEGVKKSELPKIFANLKFVVFNYDRSLEFFLAKSLENYYGLSENDAQEVVSTTTFLHPYGQVGRLPWQKSDLPVQGFGTGEKAHLFEISQSILTFSEQIDDEVQLHEIQAAVENADRIIFLGFAFHEANMQLLTADRNKDTRQVFGTAYGISEPDLEIIRNQVRRMCLTDKYLNSGVGQWILDNKATCSSLFSTYGKSITS